MHCKISDLLVEIPEAGGMAPRCRDYLTNEKESADIIIRADLYRSENYPGRNEKDMAYMESCWQYCRQLLNHDGMYLHASAVELDGKAYLFSGPSGMGKSTHTRLWQELFPQARVFNDDKPALRKLDGTWYAYGTPWCGKDGININMKVPLAGICFLRRGQENAIRRLPPLEAAKYLISQTMHRFYSEEPLSLMVERVNQLVMDMPVYEFYNLPEQAAARLSFETMRRGAEEMGL